MNPRLDIVTPRAPDGAINLYGHRYWARELTGFIGMKLTVRFDPFDLRVALKVYDQTGEQLCEAPCIRRAGFHDKEEALRQLQRRNDYLKACREARHARTREGGPQ